MKNVLLIGAGRFGRHIAMQLSQLGLQSIQHPLLLRPGNSSFLQFFR